MKVKQYRRTDILLTAEKEYENPFLEVNIDAVFTHESGVSISLPGFWKGGKQYCVRFSPTKIGDWIYTVQSNEPSLCTSGSLTCCANDGITEVDRHGFVTMDAGHRYFFYEDGTPFFWLGDTHWQAPDLERLNECNCPHCSCGSQFKHMVDYRRRQGYNVYQTYPSAADNDGGGGKRCSWWKEKYTLIDPESFNENFDKKMDYLADSGFVIVMGLGVHSITPEAMGEALCDFAKYMVARYAAYPVIWITGQEIDMGYVQGKMENYMPYIHAAELTAAYDGYHHPLGTHMLARPYDAPNSASPDIDARPWHQFWALQAGHRNELSKGSMRPKSKYYDYYKGGKPFVETEAFYEDLRRCIGGTTKNLTYSNGYEEVRNAAWKAVLCGSYGFTYGAHGIWGMRWSKDPSDGGWPSTYNAEPWFMGLYKPAGQEMRFVKDFFEAVDFTRLVPVFYDTQYGEFSSRENAVLATDGNSTYVLYLYGREGITGRLKQLDGNKIYHAWWLDVRTGAYIDAGTVQGKPEYEIPVRPDKNDWTLLVTDREFVPSRLEVLAKPVSLETIEGQELTFSASTVFTDDTTAEEALSRGQLWRPFCPAASNIIEIDLGQEVSLCCIKLDFEQNTNGLYAYRVDGIREGAMHILCDRIAEPSDKPVNIEKLQGTFRYLRLNMFSDEGYLDEEKRIVPGICRLQIFGK